MYANFSTIISFWIGIIIAYFVNLSTITSISLYLTPVIGSIDIGSFIIKSIIISFYSTSLISINCGSLYSL
jgi:hypothetical protein